VDRKISARVSRKPDSQKRTTGSMTTWKDRNAFWKAFASQKGTTTILVCPCLHAFMHLSLFTFFHRDAIAGRYMCKCRKQDLSTERTGLKKKEAAVTLSCQSNACLMHVATNMNQFCSNCLLFPALIQWVTFFGGCHKKSKHANIRQTKGTACSLFPCVFVMILPCVFVRLRHVLTLSLNL
jgi:hypothetical protein